MRRFRSLLLLALLASPAAFAQSSEEEAGDVSEIDKDRTGPLRERVAPVSGHLFRKKQRFEFSPSASVSFKDAFYRKLVFGGLLSYHLTNEFGIGLRAGYALPDIANSALICVPGETIQCNPPTLGYVDAAGRRPPGRINMLADLNLQWSPLYGKMAVVAERFLHFDIYGLLGPSAINYGAPGVETWTVGGNVGVGMRFVITNWLALRTELRDVVYVEDRPGIEADLLRNQLMFEAGFSFFFPTTFSEN